MSLARGDAATAEQELELARHSYGNTGATLQFDRLARKFA